MADLTDRKKDEINKLIELLGQKDRAGKPVVPIAEIEKALRKLAHEIKALEKEQAELARKLFEREDEKNRVLDKKAFEANLASELERYEQRKQEEEMQKKRQDPDPVLQSLEVVTRGIEITEQLIIMHQQSIELTSEIVADLITARDEEGISNIEQEQRARAIAPEVVKLIEEQHEIEKLELIKDEQQKLQANLSEQNKLQNILYSPKTIDVATLNETRAGLKKLQEEETILRDNIAKLENKPTEASTQETIRAQMYSPVLTREVVNENKANMAELYETVGKDKMAALRTKLAKSFRIIEDEINKPKSELLTQYNNSKSQNYDKFLESLIKKSSDGIENNPKDLTESSSLLKPKPKPDNNT